MKRQLRRNFATLPPFTPMPPEPSCANSAEQPAVAPDLKVESVLFAAYVRQKEIAEWAMERYRNSEKRFTLFRAKGLARGISKKLKPAHLDPQESLKK
jgi:hypothetical protein